MANRSASNITNMSRELTDATMDGEKGNVPLEGNVVIVVIINCLTCPFTILRNVLVCWCVKKRPRFQTYSNILLACLAVTDALTGFLVQPSFIVVKILQLLGETNSEIIFFLHRAIIIMVSFSSLLHLTLVTSERLTAIKFTLHYPYIVTTRKIKMAVVVLWVFTLCCERVYKESCNYFVHRFHSCVILDFVSWNSSPPQDDQNSTAIPRTGVKFC